MKVALLHDWLTGLRGGERVLQVFLSMYPNADIYSLIHVPGRTSPQIDQSVRGCSWLQSLPQVQKYYRLLLPLYPSAVRSIELGDYDLVISISHAAVKNIRVHPRSVHLCYCLTPMRYVWDQAATYFGNMTTLVQPVLGTLRSWDRHGSGPDRIQRFVAISKFVAARIRCYYGRDADVIYPPVDTTWTHGPLPEGPGEAYLYAGALVPYKRPDVVVRALSRMGRRLWIVGTGPEEGRLRHLAGPNVEFLGHLPDAELAERFRRCRALVFPACEDFGMIPVECMNAGRPVIALYAGAARETIQGLRPWLMGGDKSRCLAASDATGVFIKARSGNLDDELFESIRVFEEVESQFNPTRCRAWAETFGIRRFVEQWSSIPEVQQFSPQGLRTVSC